MEAAAVALTEEAGELPEPAAGSEVSEDEALLSSAQRLISKINAAQENPNPTHLHALASILETQEARYMRHSGSSSNARSSHVIGRLGNLVRENDEFYELVSSKFLSESRYTISVRAAAARVLLSCPSSGMYPLVFDDPVLVNLKSWVMEDSLDGSADACNWKHDLRRNKPTDFEMLKTYATGLLAMSLAGGGQVVEDILTSGLSARLMRYLRIRILRESNSSLKDIGFQLEAKHPSAPSSIRGREENMGRSRQVLDGLGIVDGVLSGDQNAERDIEKNSSISLAHEEDRDGGESLRSELIASQDVVGIHDIDMEDNDVADDGWNDRDLLDGRLKFADESVRDDYIRLWVSRGWLRSRGKGRTLDGTLENERLLLSPSSGRGLGETTRSYKDRNPYKTEDTRRVCDAKRNLIRTDADLSSIEEDDIDRFKEFLVGSRDISQIVKKATKAAEAEARAANAPAEAIKAVGDAAAELVKSSALEVWKITNEEESAVQAAFKAAFTVVDAAIATKATSDDLELKDAKFEVEEEPEEFFILDCESLAQLQEKYCILCLEILGEYVEALGPVLHEEGVDVCVALLQRCSVDGEAAEILALLPEVLKLVCALAAHKTYSALFVDRGGIQKLLSVHRASHTFVGLSSCLFTIGSLQGVMERVCALSSDTVCQVVELALELLECSQELARKNAAIFFAGAFVFRAILDSFDAQDGMQKMLHLLQKCSVVLSSQEKAIAYHTCVALRQYIRAHLLLLVDSLRTNKSSKNVARGTSNARAAYKPLDISNEAMDVVVRQIQRDKKLGSAFVRSCWHVMDKFFASNGHITMLELFQALTLQHYVHDLAPYALGVLHIVTLVPYGRKLIVNATLSNERLGMAIILDAASGAGYADPEVILPALSVLVNLVCPPPSISYKPSGPPPNQQSASTNIVDASALENREKHLECNMIEQNISLSFLNESRESNLLERGTGTVPSSQTTVLAMPSGVVGNRRICLGPGAGCAGLAAQLEQGYHQAREAVRSNNGIKVLIHLLQPRMITTPPALDSIKALVCRVLLGLARDETIAHILTKLEVGKLLSELIRDLGIHASGNEQNKWQAELSHVAVELIAIVTNSERASTIAATDAAAPTLKRIERASIAAATPITYHSRELLLLIHEHLLGSGLIATAAALQKEADLKTLPSLSVTPSFQQISFQETSTVQVHWPSGRAPCGFLLDVNKSLVRDEDTSLKSVISQSCLRKKPLCFASNFSLEKNQLFSNSSAINGLPGSSKNQSAAHGVMEISLSRITSNADADPTAKTPILLPMKRKLFELKNTSSTPSAAKRLAVGDLSSSSPLCQSPSTELRNCLSVDVVNQSPIGNLTPGYPSARINASSFPVDNSDDTHWVSTSGEPVTSTPLPQLGLPGELLPGNTERMTLDSLVVQYLKHQHRQCSAPITTLPPLSLLHPHVCPEPNRRLNAPANVTARASTREVGVQHCGIRTGHRDHQFVHSRFKPCRTCRDDEALLTCITFLSNSHCIATGSHLGELKFFDTNKGNLLESFDSHQTPIQMIQSAFSGEIQLILSSGTFDVKLWDASSILNGPLHSFDGCKVARFSHSGTTFAALSTDASSREVLLYDTQTCNVELRFPASSSYSSGVVRGHTQSIIHFSPLDMMLLWNGVLWDRRSAAPLHQFDQFTDYGGGGFHPSGNEVILNSEVWDLRKFKLLRSVPSLDQTLISFNSGGDVIYAILRRNLEDITSALNTRRIKHPLFQAFRTIDAGNYSDIATVPVDRCILDLTVDPTDTYVGVVAMDDNDDMFSSARLYEIGRRRPTNDDSDPEDGGQTDEEEDDEDDYEADLDPILGSESDVEGGSDSDDISNDEDDDSADEPDETELNIGEFLGRRTIADSDSGEEENGWLEAYSNDDEGDFTANGFGF